MNQITVSTPGRICLFGEHQDYLGLPVVAAAISRRVAVSGFATTDELVYINLPDIDSSDAFNVHDTENYTSRDYFKSSINVLRKNGVELKSGIKAEVRGNIPLQSGTSSSSALIVGWIRFLLETQNSGDRFTQADVAKMAFQAEVAEFGEPGGMMDHYSTAIGDVIHLQSDPDIKIEKIKPRLGAFVLGDSLEPKDTIGILSRVKEEQKRAIEEVKLIDDLFDVHYAKHEELEAYYPYLDKQIQRTLYATVYNQNLTRWAMEELKKVKISHKEIGRLLSEHHNILSKYLDISTPKIERMIEASLNAGALGAKINGSGGGGCMFAYAPENAQAVVEVIQSEGGKAYVIEIEEGTRIER